MGLVRNMVNLPSIVVIALNGITVSNSSGSVNGYSSSSFSRFTFLIFLSHYLVTEVAFVEVKVHAIHCAEFCVKKRFNLFWLRKRVSKYKDPFL